MPANRQARRGDQIHASCTGSSSAYKNQTNRAIRFMFLQAVYRLGSAARRVDESASVAASSGESAGTDVRRTRPTNNAAHGSPFTTVCVSAADRPLRIARLAASARTRSSFIVPPNGEQVTLAVRPDGPRATSPPEAPPDIDRRLPCFCPVPFRRRLTSSGMPQGKRRRAGAQRSRSDAPLGMADTFASQETPVLLAQTSFHSCHIPF
jgi:hypothetical protein